MKSRIGIYAGTFDPVHAGHISFALQAAEGADLDRVYFLPERRPRHKKGVEHFGHRVAMLRRAVKPHPSFDVLELDDISFTVTRTLPKLQKLFGGDRLIFLMGSDVIKNIPEWPDAERLLREVELVVGCRKGAKPSEILEMIESWSVQPRQTAVINSYAADVSSGDVRAALQDRRATTGVLPSVERYSDRNWLYVSLARPHR